jgi:hypothetical protein
MSERNDTGYLQNLTRQILFRLLPQSKLSLNPAKTTVTGISEEITEREPNVATRK